MMTAQVASAYPDALLIPDEWGTGNELEQKISLCRRAEEILGIDYEAGGRAHLSLPTDGRSFRSKRATPGRFRYRVAVPRHEDVLLFFPANSSRKGQPRYRWEPQADGSQFGYFVDEEARHAYDQYAP